LPSLPKLSAPAGRRLAGFALVFYTRMLFSCLVDADFLDTESFLSPDRSGLRRGEGPTCEQLLDRLNGHLAEKARKAEDTPVNRRRREVLASCREKSRLPPGSFSLHVPTGSDKTLSSLAFALVHAVEQGQRRVVCAIPFTSIIEQTADTFREVLGDLGGEVLEHYSNLNSLARTGDPRHHVTSAST
jgi:CRISPR/Cas system-associated endonuclease/helicase Cas3